MPLLYITNTIKYQNLSVKIAKCPKQYVFLQLIYYFENIL